MTGARPWPGPGWRAAGTFLALVLLPACAPATPIRRPSLPPADGPAIDPGLEPAIRSVPREPRPAQQLQADAIRRGLAVVSPMLAASLDVHVGQQGTALLRGEVASQRLRRQAAEIAGAVEGIVEVKNEIRVLPPMASDEQIAGNVTAALQAEPALAGARLKVEVEEGLATLRGSLPSAPLASLAEEVAAAVAGVRDVASAIEVPAPLPAPSDPELRGRVEDAVLGVADGGMVQVLVYRRVVTLQGRVKSFTVRQEMLARAWVPGVRAVRAPELKVFWREPAGDQAARERERFDSDEEIGARVAGALEAQPRLSRASLRIRVRQGVVHLAGRVSTLHARAAAERTAALTAGVRSVKNDLEVRPEPRERQLVSAVVAALARDPYLDHRTLQVRAQNGHVHLEGEVDAPFEVERAAQVASQVAGVSRVTNGIGLARPASR